MTTTAAAGVTASGHPLETIRVLHGRELRPSARLAETCAFDDDIWRLEPAILQHHQRASRLDFAQVPVAYRTVAKELAYALLSGPTPPGESRSEIATIRTQFVSVVRFLDWLAHREPVRTLAELSAADLQEYQRFVIRTCRGDIVRRRARAAVRLFWRYRDVLNTDRLRFDPGQIEGWTGGPQHCALENATDRIPEPVLGPLLAWAIRFVDDFAADILRADALWRAMRRHRTRLTGPLHGGRDALLQLLADHETRNRPLPGHRGSPNINMLAVLAATDTHTILRNRAVVDAAAARVGVSASTFDIAIHGRLDDLPWLEGIETIHRGTDQGLACLARMLQASAYVVLAFFSGMRDSEIKHLRRGCLHTQHDPDGVAYRHSVRSLAFKGESNAAGVPATWIVGAPASRAITVLEQLQPPTTDLLFAPLRHGPGSAPASRATNAALTSSSTNHQLNALLAWIDQYCATRGRNDGIPSLDGRAWRLQSRQFRRTLAWFIARRPGGSIAGAIQYRHHSIQMFEGYAGTSDSGFRAEVESEQALTRGEHLLAMVEVHEHDNLTGPAAEDAIQRLTEFGDRARFTGTVVTDPRRLQRLMARADPAVYPGKYVTCVFDHTKALCRPAGPSGERATPRLPGCQPLDCRNVALDAANKQTWQAELERLDHRLTARPPLPPLLHHQLTDRRQHIARSLAMNTSGPV